MTKILAPVGFLALAIALFAAPRPAAAVSASDLERDAIAALEKLYAASPDAKLLGEKAKGILIFPTIAKAGFLFAGEFGNGVLRKGDTTAGYYNITEVSYGFQAGIEKFSYALFFMNEGALSYLDKSGGFQLGAGPSLTVVDKGFAGSLTTTTIFSDVYAFSFGEEGLMGGISLKGSKITRFHPDGE